MCMYENFDFTIPDHQPRQKANAYFYGAHEGQRPP